MYCLMCGTILEYMRFLQYFLVQNKIFRKRIIQEILFSMAFLTANQNFIFIRQGSLRCFACQRQVLLDNLLVIYQYTQVYILCYRKIYCIYMYCQDNATKLKNEFFLCRKKYTKIKEQPQICIFFYSLTPTPGSFF